jgi:tetratricopeptide (TPR) repeat protein
MLLAACALVVAIYGLIACSADSELGNPTAKEAYYNRLVDGLLKGELALDLAVPKGLVDLPNPYDRRANLAFQGLMFEPGRLHDLSYYKGRLYMYFSLVPALVVFLPVHLLTGAYLSHEQACFLFASTGFLASVALLSSVQRRCFKNVGPAVVTAGALCAGLVPLVPVVLERADVWEVPITGSYAFWMLSLLALWSSLNGPPRAWPGLALVSALVGLAVGCRPNGFLGSLILVVPLWRIVREFRRGERAQSACAAVALMLPVGLIGCGLLAYNYARFGSFTEFGQSFQLNIDATRHTENFSPSFLSYNFKLYFLSHPNWQPHFPFIGDFITPAKPAGHTAVENPVGAFTLLPFVLCAAAIPLGFRSKEGRPGQTLGALVGAALIIFLSSTGVFCMFIGAGARYQLEFLPELVLLAVIGFFALASGEFGPRPARFGVLSAVYVAAAFSIAFNLLMTAKLRATSYMYRGNGAMHLGQWESAGKFYTRALRLGPSEVNSMMGLGLSHLQEGRVEESRGELQRVVDLFPESAAAHANLGNALFSSPGRLNDAIAQYEEALRLNPDYPEAHYNLGNALFNSPGRLNDAIAHYEEALRLKPDYPEAHNSLGIALEKVPGRRNDAISHYEEALRLKPDFAAAHNNLGDVWFGVPGRLNDAISQYEAAARLEPNSAEILVNLGTALDVEGRTEVAISRFAGALRLKPDFAEAHYHLGNVLLRIPGRIDDAVVQFEATLRLEPNFAAAHYKLALALLRIPGRRDDARAQLETALRLQPGNEAAKKLLGMIGSPEK